MRNIYLDNAATTMIDQDVLDAMMPYLTSEYGNAGTLYSLGFTAHNAVEKAREQVAEFIGAESPEHIIFTSGGTESNNTVFHNFGMNETNKRGILVSSIEHDSVLRPAEFLKTKFGFDVSYIKPNNLGEIDVEEFEKMVCDGKIGLASIMYMNNEVGSINRIKDFARVCRENNVLLHSDCVQAAGCIEVNVEELGCDYASLSSHKIHAPKGVGALYVRDLNSITPLVLGGTSQEFGFRGGTENVAGIVGFGKACELIQRWYEGGGTLETIYKRAFWNTLRQGLREYNLEDIVHDNAISSISHGKVLSVRFDGVDAESLVLMLGARGVYVSAGSACSSHEQKPSHVLLGIGLSEDDARSTVRISFSRMNTVDEVEEAARIMVMCVTDIIDIR